MIHVYEVQNNIHKGQNKGQKRKSNQTTLHNDNNSRIIDKLWDNYLCYTSDSWISKYYHCMVKHVIPIN